VDGATEGKALIFRVCFGPRENHPPGFGRTYGACWSWIRAFPGFRPARRTPPWAIIDGPLRERRLLTKVKNIPQRLKP